MPELIIAPDIETVLFERRGIWTLPLENASVRCLCPEGKPCPGIDIDKLPHSEVAFQHLAKDYGERFIRSQKPRGFDFPTSGRLALHGPFPSYGLNDRLADIESSHLKEAMRRDKDGIEQSHKALDFVFERTAYDPYVDYFFVGRFLTKDKPTDIPLEEVTPDGDGTT